MSLKMLDMNFGEDRKSADNASWTDGELEDSTTAGTPMRVEVHRLPTHGVRGLLAKINWIFPIISGVLFLSTQLGLIFYWVVASHKTTTYPTMHAGQTVPYLSDIGANQMKPLFISGFSLSAIFFSLGLTVDRWAIALSLPRSSISKWQRVRSILMVVFVWLGSAFLVMMTALDSGSTRSIHIIFLFVFFFKYAGLAVTFCWELRSHGYNERGSLRGSFWFKTACIVVEMSLGISTAIFMYTDRPNQGAIIEWILSFIFFFFACSFAVDFYPTNMEHRRFNAKSTKISKVIQVKDISSDRLPLTKDGSSSRSIVVECKATTTGFQFVITV